MAQQGQADGYYDSRNTYQEDQTPQGPPPKSYAPPQQGYDQQYQAPQPPQQDFNQQYHTPQQGHEPKYALHPPTYGEAFVPPQDSNQDFKETFKIQKPKWNDLWAGLLVRTHSESDHRHH